MNGAEYDKTLREIEANRTLRDTDIDGFCKFVINQVRNMRGYRYTDRDSTSLKENNTRYGKYQTITGNYDYEKLENDVNNDRCNPWTVTYADKILQMVYDFYKAQLSTKIDLFTLSVKKDIEESKKDAWPLVLLDNLIKIVVLLGTTFVSFILIFNLFEKWVLIAISLITTIATVVDRVYKFGVKNRNMAIILEKMEQEYMLHNSSIGSYKSFGEGTALDIFMDRIDQLRQERSKLRLDHEKTIEDRFQKLEESSKDLNR